jgi:hypothetical protein
MSRDAQQSEKKKEDKSALSDSSKIAIRTVWFMPWDT